MIPSDSVTTELYSYLSFTKVSSLDCMMLLSCGRHLWMLYFRDNSYVPVEL